MFQDLGINSRPHTKGGDNVCYSIEHYNERAEDDDGDTLAAQDQYYDINGVWERCTGAHVRFGINQRGGRKYLRVDVDSPSCATGSTHAHHTRRHTNSSK